MMKEVEVLCRSLGLDIYEVSDYFIKLIFNSFDVEISVDNIGIDKPDTVVYGIAITNGTYHKCDDVKELKDILIVLKKIL